MSFLYGRGSRVVLAGILATLISCGGDGSSSGNSLVDTQGGGSGGEGISGSFSDNLSCYYNYHRRACELLTEDLYVASFRGGLGNNCPSNVDPDFQLDFFDQEVVDSFGVDEIGTCVIDDSRGPGGLSNFDRLTTDGSGGAGTGGGGSTANSSRWILADGCADGEGIQARFHEVRNGSRTGLAWPGGSQVYLADPGGTIDVNLACTAGTLICFGATKRVSVSSGSWGIGIDGSQPCSDCCTACGGDRNINLTCN